MRPIFTGLWALAGLAVASATSAASAILLMPISSGRAETLSQEKKAPALFRQQLHRALEALERGGEHAPVHQLLEYADRLAVAPDFLRLGVEPDAFRVDVGEALDPHR